MPVDSRWYRQFSDRRLSATACGEERMGTNGAKMPFGAGFNTLSEGCIAYILSLTTPPEVCRLSLVSSIFGSAAASDDVWERFLPSDYHSIISRSDDLSPSFNPLKKKQLYFRLCDIPLLIDGGKMSFSLDKWTGKKCYMIAARQLTIIGDGTAHYSSLSWESLPQSRFAEVAMLRGQSLFEIRGKINTGMLSPETTYAAYLVCKFTEANEFESTRLHVSVGIVGRESCKRTVWIGKMQRRVIQRIGQVFVSALSWPKERNDHYVKERGDGWLEIELGEYSNEGEADEELEMRLKKVKRIDWESGLTIQGIEIRPKRE